MTSKAFELSQLGDIVAVSNTGNVGIGVTAPTQKLHLEQNTAATPIQLRVENDSATSGANALLVLVTVGNNFSLITYPDADTPNANRTDFGSTAGSSYFTFSPSNSERMRIDSSGTVLIGKATADSGVTSGIEFEQVGLGRFTRASTTAVFDRLTTDGVIVSFRRDNTGVGDIGSASAGTIYIGSGDTTLTFAPSGDAIVPSGTAGATRSGLINLGNSGNRWDTVFATVGTINTSDRNEKQDIEELNDAERRVAVACKGLLRKYRLKSAIAKKGEDARIHFGIIAQDLQAAFEAEGLDAGRYGMFIHSTWTDEETGEEKSLMGVRYSELLAFMIAAL